ncbi:MAG: hypothetical protein GXP62_12550 [Oligoflexia bacterium]|nr:hypothetical protein [Oligoflexia bacterium]
MDGALLVDTQVPSRTLVRMLRRQPDRDKAIDVLPESVLWHVYCELRRRGETQAGQHFVRSVKNLHRRRSLGNAMLPCTDTAPNEHKLIDDPMVAELWRAYKRCICAQRTGPAAQLLRDIESRL